MAHFSTQARKIEKIHLEKKFLMFQEMELSDSKTKKLLIIFQKKTSLKFQIWKPALFSPSSKNIKTSHIFSKQCFLYISGKGNPGNSLYLRKQIFLIFQETEILENLFYFRKQLSVLLKCFLYLRKWNVLVPNLRNFLYFRKELTKSEKWKVS